MTVASIARHIENELRTAGTRDRAAHERAYLKSTLVHFGASVPVIRRVTKAALREEPRLTRAGLLRAVDLLWSRGVHELRMAAVEMLDVRGDLLRAEDVRLLERLVREAGTWALVDGLAATVAGGLVARYPRVARTLDRWATDKNFWLRRAAMLALLVPLRRGEGDFVRFARYADAMLEDEESFIRKAIGWVLRDTSRKRPALVLDWLAPRAARASGVTVREAVKYLPARERERLLEAYRGSRRGRRRKVS